MGDAVAFVYTFVQFHRSETVILFEMEENALVNILNTKEFHFFSSFLEQKETCASFSKCL